MSEQTSAANAFVVGRNFNLDQLPAHLEHLECYSWLGSDIVLIEGKGNPPAIAFFEKGTDQIICRCLQTKQGGTCDHQQALSNGLWARLVALSPADSLVTCTQDWCEYVPFPLPPLLSSIQTQVTFAKVTGR